MKALFTATLLFVCIAGMAQREIDTTWRRVVTPIFRNLDPQRVPHQLLLDYAMEFTNVQAYNGQLTDSTIVDVNAFGNIYKTLFMSQLVPQRNTFPKMEQIANRWSELRIANNRVVKDTIIIAGLLYKYSKIDSEAHRLGRIRVDRNAYADSFIDGQWQNPYNTMITMALTPPIHNLDKRSFKVILPNRLFLTNIGGTITRIDANFNDGQGWRDISRGDAIPVSYQQNGKYIWDFRIVLNDNATYYSRSIVSVQMPEADQAQANYENNVFIPGPGNTSIFGTNGAILRIDYAPGHNGQLLKPFIVAEGFDPGVIVAPELSSGLNSYQNFLNSIITGSFDLSQILANDSSQQYDIVYVDWQNGTNSIQHNSAVLKNVILWVNSKKQLNGSTNQNILLGQSMGGLIGRYALADMEEESIIHDVELFIAHDSPLQGANTPISVQHLARHVYDLYTDSPAYSLLETIVPSILNFIELMSFNSLEIVYPSIDDILTLNDTPAAMQMNYYYVNFNAQATDDPHSIWQAEFDAKGYPTQCRNVAISNGNECGNTQDIGPQEKIISLHDTDNPDFFGDLVHLLATPLIGILGGDIGLSLLGLLPGSSEYRYDFDVHANPSLTDSSRKIYSGKISYKKTFLWLLPITYIITKRDKNCPLGYEPFETYAGGNFDVRVDLPVNFPSGTFVNPIYGFIPVVSSLDIKRNNGPVTSADYYDKYAGGQTPEPLLTTQFDNFIVGALQNDLNYFHLSFQPRNGRWLKEELIATSTNTNYPEYNCSYLCANDPVIGPETLCDTEIFSVTSGAENYNWSVIEGDHLVTLGTNGSNTIAITNSEQGAGQVVIEVVYGDNGVRCKTITKTFTFWVGLPEFSDITCYALGLDFCSGSVNVSTFGVPSFDINNRVYAHFNGLTVSEANQNSNWEWQANNSKINIQENGNIGYIIIYDHGFTGFKVRAQNVCGWSEWHNMNFTINEIPEPLGRTAQSEIFKIYPNPTNGELHIDLRGENNSEKIGSSSAGLYDMQNRLQRIINFHNSQATIDVGGMSKGIYILKINFGNTVEHHLIAIE